MKYIILGLILMGLCILIIIGDTIWIKKEEEKEKKRRERARICRDCVRMGTCPKDCTRCAWGHYED